MAIKRYGTMVKILYIFVCGFYKLNNCRFLITDGYHFYVNLFLSHLNILNDINFNYLYGNNKFIQSIPIYIHYTYTYNHQFYHKVTYSILF